MTKLDGAGNVPEPMETIKGPAEFAALWNIWTEEQRETWWNSLSVIFDRSASCVIRNHDALEQEIGNLYNLMMTQEITVRLIEQRHGWVVEP